VYLDQLPKPEYCRCQHCKPIPGEEVIGFREKNGIITVHRRDCSVAIGDASQWGDSIVAVDFKGNPDVLYPATLTAKAVDRQHLLSDIIETISNRLHLSINSLNTVTKDEIVTCTINFYVHDNTELLTIVNDILSIPDVDEVKFDNT
jgi:GTP pyrophosphokinase